MNKAAENQSDKSVDAFESFMMSEGLVFVVMEAQGASMVAIESRYGMVAFADNVADLKKEIVCQVEEHFHGKFQGEVRVRQFVDEIITL